MSWSLSLPAWRLSTTKARLERLTDRVVQLAARMDAVTQRADRAHGYLVERRYAEKGHAYCQRKHRRGPRGSPACGR